MIEFTTRRGMAVICTYVILGLSLITLILIKPAILWLIFERLFKNTGEKKYFSLYRAMYEIISKRIYKTFAINVSENNSWQKLMGDIATILMESFEADGYSVLLTPENKEWEFIVWHKNYDKDSLSKIASILERDKECNIYDVIRSKDVVVINNTKKYKKWQGIGTGGNMKSWIGIPIMDNNEKVIGVMSIDFFFQYDVSKWKRTVARLLINDLRIINNAYRDLISLIYEPNIDPVTKNLNKNALKIDIKRYLKNFESIGLIYIKITNFEKLGKIYGQCVIIETLLKTIEKLEDIVEDKGKIYSISSNELAILIPNPIPGSLLAMKKRISTEFLRVVSVEKDLRKYFIKLDLKIGMAAYPDDVEDAEQLLHAAVKNAESNF